jgi:hypothetical protein
MVSNAGPDYVNNVLASLPVIGLGALARSKSRPENEKREGNASLATENQTIVGLKVAPRLTQTKLT